MTTGNLRHFGETDQRGEIVWHPVFLDFARYWDFTPRLCRPYRYYTSGQPPLPRWRVSREA